MTHLLTLGAAILAAGVFEDTGDALASPDMVFPKHIMDGYQLVEFDGELPDGFMPALYELVDGQLVRKADAPPPAPPVAVPQEVSRRRGLRALFEMYRLKETDIEAAIIECIANDAQQYLALSEFRTSQTFERNRALVVMMGHLLDLDLDALFIYAAKLP